MEATGIIPAALVLLLVCVAVALYIRQTPVLPSSPAAPHTMTQRLRRRLRWLLALVFLCVGVFIGLGNALAVFVPSWAERCLGEADAVAVTTERRVFPPSGRCRITTSDGDVRATRWGPSGGFYVRVGGIALAAAVGCYLLRPKRS